MPVEFIRMTRADFLSKNYLSKFMPLEYALGSLKNKYLWLANPTQWEDPFEKRFVTAKYIDEAGKEKDFSWLGRVFCICFTQTPRSEAYWSVYSRKEIGIQLRINRSELLKELDEFSKDNENFKVYIGKVEYMKAIDIKKPLSQIPMVDKPKNMNSSDFKARLLLLKRKDFEYENEIRIIVVKRKETQEKGIRLPIKDIYQLINQITIDPSAGNNTTDALKYYLTEKLGFTPIDRTMGQFHRVVRSNLYMENQSNVKIPLF